ncbi:MAG: hypothetical protein PHG81_07865, partial [Aliarcobacter sp.]|nr:hypothetical protein [Aliarcobacter sp.]
VASISGGGFASVDSTATANVTVTDTVDTTSVSVTTSDVNEDADSVTFNFQTSNAPDAGRAASLTITLNGVEQTVDLDATGKGTLVVNTKDSDVYNDSQSYEVVVTSINGGNFEATSVVDANAVANVTDIDAIDSVKVRLSTSGATSEDGGSITYTATINHAAKNDVTVTTEQGD